MPANGITQPPAAGVLTTDAPVPGSTVGGTYSTTLELDRRGHVERRSGIVAAARVDARIARPA